MKWDAEIVGMISSLNRVLPEIFSAFVDEISLVRRNEITQVDTYCVNVKAAHANTRYVVKVARNRGLAYETIRREARCTSLLSKLDLNVPVFHSFSEEFAVFVREYVYGQPWASISKFESEISFQRVEQLGRDLARFHCFNDTDEIDNLSLPSITPDDHLAQYRLYLQEMNSSVRSRLEPILACLCANVSVTLPETRLCHRDLSPENILVTSDGRNIFLDWGEAALCSPSFDISFALNRCNGLLEDEKTRDLFIQSYLQHGGVYEGRHFYSALDYFMHAVNFASQNLPFAPQAEHAERELEFLTVDEKNRSPKY
jgi:aminoglycoside phosphotransferase (APT) family kinase protein